jgi:hypothetical protein
MRIFALLLCLFLPLSLAAQTDQPTGTIPVEDSATAAGYRQPHPRYLG